MAAFCLTKDIADKLKAAAIKGDINIADMYEMTSSQRRALFSKYVDSDTARQINAGFESAMISTQADALSKWAERTFKGKANESKRKDVAAKVKSLEKTGVLTPQGEDAFLDDLAATKLGATVTAEEVGKIVELANKMEASADQRNELGLPTLEYFKAKREMEDYLASIEPSGQIKVLTSTIGRGTMLLNFKSTLLNIESNTIQAFLQAAERRFETRRIGGVNNKIGKEYRDYVLKVWNETGFDVSRLRTLDDEGKVLGEERVTSQGKGVVRALGRFYEDIVFKKMMGTPDVIFSALAFADSANLTSTMLAKAEGLTGEKLVTRAGKIFRDATRIDPQTPQGKKVREQAIADAEVATYTNKSAYSDLALGIRTAFNAVQPDLRLGDQLLPFVKTPANVVALGIEASGILLPFQIIIDTAKFGNDIRKGESISDARLNNFKGYMRKFVRAGLGMSLAYILAEAFEPEDFIGEYPTTTKEQELLRLQKASPNSVRIGDKWISLDYFGVLGTPFIGMMYAKKYGEGQADQIIYNYYLGSGRQVLKIPSLDVAGSLKDLIEKQRFGEAETVTEGLQKAAQDFVTSRLVPSIIYDVAKATDQYEREVKPTDAYQSFQSKLPFLRQQLPPKINVLGETVQTESALNQLLFGSRVKSVNTNPVVEEYTRLAGTGNLPAISDYERTNERYKQLKEQVGEAKFMEVKRYFGTNMNIRTSRLIASARYKRLSDEDKAKEINKIKQDLLDETLKKFRYRKPKN
jgi:hypothetical protein